MQPEATFTSPLPCPCSRSAADSSSHNSDSLVKWVKSQEFIPAQLAALINYYPIGIFHWDIEVWNPEWDHIIKAFFFLLCLCWNLICIFSGVLSPVCASMFPRSTETWLHKLASCLNPSWITHQPPHTDMGKNVMHDSHSSFNCALARRGDWSWLRWKLGGRYKIFMAHKELLSGPGRNIKVTDFMFTLNQIEWLAKFLQIYILTLVKFIGECTCWEPHIGLYSSTSTQSLLYFCPINISTATQRSLNNYSFPSEPETGAIQQYAYIRWVTRTLWHAARARYRITAFPISRRAALHPEPLRSGFNPTQDTQKVKDLKCLLFMFVVQVLQASLRVLPA